jgi:hygromycin-B 4-O-kinase
MVLTMQRKEPTPSAKREITLEEASEFLSEHYPSQVTNLKGLMGGKHSIAFSYRYSESDLIIRFNTDDKGFLKDKYAFEHFGKYIPIPKIIELGVHKDLFYCTTEKISGETARDQYNKNDFNSLSLLYAAVEKISKIEVRGTGYGYLNLNGNAPYQSSSDYIKSVYNSKDLFDWDKIFQIPFVSKNFTDYIAKRMEYFDQFATGQRELLHGDFGADNIFINNNAVSGVIDWEKMRTGDHFLDVGRVLLFCPNRQATTSAAIEFYKDKKIENWKERAAMGVYHVVLTNYAYAALGGNETSCRNSEIRLKELEEGLGLKFSED